MNFNYAKEFLALAEVMNYSKAARQLFISQPTLSRHIQLLEKELGSKLVKTSSHDVRLTAFGEDAVRSFSKIIKEYENLCERAKRYASDISGKLKIGLLYYSIEDYFSDFIPWFRGQYPAIALDIYSYQPHQLYEDLQNGKIDIGQICAVSQDDPELCYQKILDTGLVAMMSTHHPLADLPGISLQQIACETLVELSEDQFSSDLTRQVLLKHHIFPKNTISTETIETVPYTIRRYGGIHLTGDSVRKQGGKDIVYLPVTDQSARVGIYFVHLKQHTGPAVETFMKEAGKFFIKQN